METVNQLFKLSPQTTPTHPPHPPHTDKKIQNKTKNLIMGHWTIAQSL